ncbi:hypothetical protein B0F90DRAFT_1790971 [Multifurca ochricompacta]|uniref:Uncharacterized protein n=1 Tax=Multifurca ochricompacta TaxID=376703 RepID=A0AAD4QE67_9AGAM|nr:hypothetical protein B0F90DRAFT_1790971 [Multifurca ochricompacta]
MNPDPRLAVHHRRSALLVNSPIFHLFLAVKGDKHPTSGPFRYGDPSDEIDLQIINLKGIEIHQATGNILLIGSYSVPHQSLDSTHLRACLDCVLPQRRNDSETSTIVKQMEIIHQNGSAHEGLLAFRSFIW